MNGIHVRALGALHIERDDQEVRDLPAQPVRCALFLYLAVERAASRDRLAELLWPDREPERARHSLSQTLYELRRRLGEDWLQADTERVRVTDAVSVDAQAFSAAIKQGEDAEALSLYQGPFLAGSHIGTTNDFESWVDRQRSQLARSYRELCRRLTTAQVQAGEREAALVVARRWVEMDPLDDEAQHSVIDLLASTGLRAEALRQYDEYQALIARELDVQPLEETKALAARIREGGSPAAPVDVQSVPPPTASSSGEPPALAPHAPSPRRRFGRWWVAAVAAAAAAAIYFTGASEPSAGPAGPVEAAPAIAVLPFVNMSPDPEQEYFSDGITEELITTLSGIEGLRVISRSSVMPYKGGDASLPEIARALGVTYVVEGSVRREGNQVRITAQLIDAATDAHLWADSYDRELTGIFEIQSDIAERIAGALEQRLSVADRSRIAAGGTTSTLAYDMYLQGMGYLNRPGGADVRKYEPAMNYFRRALQLDPEYARPYVGLSSAFRLHVALPERLRRDSALAYAQKAVSLEPNLPVALAALGAAHLFASDESAAAEMYERTLRLDPNNSEAMAGLARLARRDGRFDEAVRWAVGAVSVDPSTSARHSQLGSFLFDLGALDGAQSAFERALELSPDLPEAAYHLAMILLIHGEEERAETTMRTLLAHASDHQGTHITMGMYLARVGRYQEADEYLAKVPPGDDRIVVALYRTFVAMQSGDHERAAETLSFVTEALDRREREGLRYGRARLAQQSLSGNRDGALATFTEHVGSGLRDGAGPAIGLYWIDFDPLLHGLVGDPRFQTLLAQTRASLDSMRALLPEDPYRHH